MKMIEIELGFYCHVRPEILISDISRDLNAIYI